MIGYQDLIVLLGLGIFFFGAKKLPELSRSLGQALSEFKKGVAEGTPDGAASGGSGPPKSEAGPAPGGTAGGRHP